MHFYLQVSSYSLKRFVDQILDSSSLSSNPSAQSKDCLVGGLRWSTSNLNVDCFRNGDKIKIVEIINENWDKISFKEGQKHMDVLIDNEPFLEVFGNKNYGFIQ